MGNGTVRSRILQVHPTRQCNLQCLHCYSSSGPAVKEWLPAGLLEEAIADGRDEGYTTVGFSGGEPLLYKDLPRILAFSRRCGLLTTVTSNGMLLDERRLSEIAPHVDLLAISLDGEPRSHNIMRGHPQAFERMATRLESVRRSGVPFGFIFTLTQYNLNELPWVAQFAVENEARLLQIHPLESAGRAIDRLAGHEPDVEEVAYGLVAAIKLKEAFKDRLTIQLDAVTKTSVLADHRDACRGESLADPGRLLAEVVEPLVIEASGTVVPLQYGIARRYALGNLSLERLKPMGHRWRIGGYDRYRALCRRTAERIRSTRQAFFGNWYGAVCQTAAMEEAAAFAVSEPAQAPIL